MTRRLKRSVGSPTGKVLAVLNAVARLDAPSVSVLADNLAIPIATTHRICGQLQRLGYLERLPSSRRWTVSSSLVNLSADVLRSAARGAAVNAILKNLTAEVGEMSSFAIQVGDEVVYIASVEPPHDLTISFRAGRTAPLFCTSSGRLFLAQLSDQELSRYLRVARRPAYTRYTQTDIRKLMATISRVRTQGYAITNQEYVLHIVGAAVPVLRSDSTVYGALSIAAPDVRLSLARLKKLIPILKSAATRLHETFSGRNSS
jgi:IclR family transcriptional regulator, acetate operon repressor